MPKKPTRWVPVQWSSAPREAKEEFSVPEFSSIKELIEKAFATHFQGRDGVIYKPDPLHVPQDERPVPLVFCSI